jgi:hypothetical protein
LKTHLIAFMHWVLNEGVDSCAGLAASLRHPLAAPSMIQRSGKLCDFHAHALTAAAWEGAEESGPVRHEPDAITLDLRSPT